MRDGKWKLKLASKRSSNGEYLDTHRIDQNNRDYDASDQWRYCL